MRALAISTLFFVATAAASAPTEDAAGPRVALEQCIRNNAAKVETAISDLNQAVDFLVAKVCAEALARLNADTERAQQAARAAQLKAMCDKHKADTKKDDTGRTFNFCGVSDYAVGFITEPANDDEEAALPFAGANSSPASVALASRLLLDLRQSHLKSGQIH